MTRWFSRRSHLLCGALIASARVAGCFDAVSLPSPAEQVRRRRVLAIVALLVFTGCSAGPAASSAPSGALRTRPRVGLDYEVDASGVGNGNPGGYVTDYDRDGWPDVHVESQVQAAANREDHVGYAFTVLADRRLMYSSTLSTGQTVSTGRSDGLLTRRFCVQTDNQFY